MVFELGVVLLSEFAAAAQILDFPHPGVWIELVCDRLARGGDHLFGDGGVDGRLSCVDDLVVALTSGFRAEYVPGGCSDNELNHGGHRTGCVDVLACVAVVG